MIKQGSVVDVKGQKYYVLEGGASEIIVASPFTGETSCLCANRFPDTLVLKKVCGGNDE
jgi:hypothetical protein